MKSKAAGSIALRDTLVVLLTIAFAAPLRADALSPGSERQLHGTLANQAESPESGPRRGHRNSITSTWDFLPSPPERHREWAGFWVAPGIGGTAYRMAELKDRIRVANLSSSTSNPSPERVDSKVHFVGSIGFDFHDGARIGLAYDRLPARTGTSIAGSDIVFEVPANSYRLFGAYAISPVPEARASVGLAAGLITVSGHFRVHDAASGGYDAPIQGRAATGEFFLGVDWINASPLGLMLQVGYRSARVRDAKLDGAVWSDLDYSGPLARLQAKIRLE